MPTFPRTAEADKQLNVLRNSDPLLKMFRDAYGSINKEILEPLGPYNPEAPALAIVPTALNLQKFLAKMAAAEKLQDATEINHLVETGIPFKMGNAVKKGLAYMEARYPRVIGSIEQGVEASPDLNPALYGQVFENPEQIPVSVKIDPNIPDPSQVVQTVGHELKHVRDIRRKHWSTWLPYVSPSTSKGMSRTLSDLRDFLYHNQPTERRAEAAGEAALKSYHKFMDLISTQGSIK